MKFAVLTGPRPITRKAAKAANQAYLRSAAATAALALRQYSPRRPFVADAVLFSAALPKPHDTVGEASPYP